MLAAQTAMPIGAYLPFRYNFVVLWSFYDLITNFLSVSSLSKLQQLTNGVASSLINGPGVIGPSGLINIPSGTSAEPCNTPPAPSMNLTPSPNHHPHNTMTPPPSHLVNQNRNLSTPPSTVSIAPYHKYYSTNINW